jgi:glycosylphosphatidylinositol transamidase
MANNSGRTLGAITIKTMTESIETNPIEDNTKESEDKARKRRKKVVLLLIIVPYVVGILWHSVHPLVSVFTGHSEPRRWYIDENSLEPAYFRMEDQYDIISKKRKGVAFDSLCQALAAEDSDAISCFRHETHFEVARILPTIGAVSPVIEAIVIVVPTTENWAASQFHASVLQLIRRLSTAPWLAKTILVVTPVATQMTSTNGTLQLSETVDSFLESYLGSRNKSPSSTRSPLPPRFTGAMLRNILVLDIDTKGEDSPLGNEIRILPQGRRGVLPNMDLTFLATVVYSKSKMISSKANGSTMVMHPYRGKANELWTLWIQPHLPEQLHDWARKLTEFLLFEYSLLMGPYPPHASALDRGIDSLTIQGVMRLGSETARAVGTAQFVQKMEPTLRALSNLHERLHHSTSLYLLVSPERFVKHEEYLVPNLLLVIPLVVRLITLALLDIPRFHWDAVGWALQWTLAGTVAFVAVGLPMVDSLDPSLVRNRALQVMFGMIYLFLFVHARYRGVTPSARQSIQLLACMLAILVNVPIAFGHVALAFPSALLWTPLIAFPSYADTTTGSALPKKDNGLATKVFGWMSLLWWFGVLFITCPCTFLVPRVFPGYTAYVQYGYIPLHLLVTILQLSRIRDHRLDLKACAEVHKET